MQIGECSVAANDDDDDDVDKDYDSDGVRTHKVHKLGGCTRAHEVHKRCRQVEVTTCGDTQCHLEECHGRRAMVDM